MSKGLKFVVWDFEDCSFDETVKSLNDVYEQGVEIVFARNLGNAETFKDLFPKQRRLEGYSQKMIVLSKDEVIFDAVK